MWVIFGSNVGTTMTGWIVALVGFDLKIEAFALPLLGIGMFLSLTGAATRRGALGEALAGFGVFFLGIATLKATFAELGKSIDLASFAVGGIVNDLLFVALGFVMTTLVQSSSAVMAIALTAAVGGLLTIEAGAAVVIGANVGTTTTALLSVIGATANARRVAVSHVAFNVVTGVVALLLLPLLILIIDAMGKTLTAAAGPATTLALFHTVFNILGVAIVWPLAGWLERWLAGRFVTAEEDESRPRYLDSNSLAVPALAVNALLLELRRVADIALAIAKTAIIDPEAPAERLWRRNTVIANLHGTIVDYVQRLNAAKISQATAEALSHPIRALWHFAEIADLGLAIAGRRRQIEALPQTCHDQIAN
jgi:phosphate:Na+ symporter